MNWRRLVAGVLVAGGLAAVGAPAQASTGTSFFKKTWEVKPTWWHNWDKWGWELGLTSVQATELLNRAEDVKDTGGIVKDLLDVIKEEVPLLNSWNLVASIDTFALKRCSDHGQNGVTIYGYHEYRYTHEIEVDADGWPTGRTMTKKWEGDVVYWCSPQ